MSGWYPEVTYQIRITGMRPDTRRKGSPPTVALCAVRQRQVDPLREDHSLAVWRLGAHLARCCPDVPVRILDLKHDQVEEAFEKIAYKNAERLVGD